MCTVCAYDLSITHTWNWRTGLGSTKDAEQLVGMICESKFILHVASDIIWPYLDLIPACKDVCHNQAYVMLLLEPAYLGFMHHVAGLPVYI